MQSPPANYSFIPAGLVAEISAGCVNQTPHLAEGGGVGGGDTRLGELQQERRENFQCGWFSR